MIGFLGAGGGAKKSGIGNKLTVTAPVNTDVTAKMGGSVKVENSGADGSAVFKDLAQGSWDISIANAEQTITVPTVVTTNFFTTIAFFESHITVTYPKGATCTCSNGDTVYTAPNTNGSYTFYVPRTGTWTVSGTACISKYVEVTADGQDFSITLNYWNGQLFAGGDQFEFVTGGWVGWGSLTPTIDAASIRLGGTNYTLAVRTKNKVDVTKFSRLCFTGRIVAWGGNIGFGLMDHEFVWTAMSYVAAIKGSDSSDGKLDISSVTGSYYITAHIQSENACSIELTKVWME